MNVEYLTPKEIQKLYPGGPRSKTPNDQAKPLREGLEAERHFSPAQLAGRNFPMACIALEITQRCNLDCTLCYLSDLAEAVEDVPLFELKRRIKHIYDHYGPHTNIQITGGDPTLRSIPDLIEIVKEIKSYPMRCALFTNGIKASRKMLKALSAAGMDDVVFHVDMTQERKGFSNEMALNTIRLDYIKRAKDLPMRILFNTTIFDDNVKDIPKLVNFFISQAEHINLASFQMQADTGRGVLRARDEDLITQQKVMSLLEEGAGIKLPYDLPMIGHPDCNKYTAVLKAGNAVTPLYDHPEFFKTLFPAIAKDGENWSTEDNVLPSIIKASIHSPKLLWLGFIYGIQKIWNLKSGLIRGHKPHRISFFIHNFMDAEKLERGRCESCVFMVATANGPLSMCVHNAKRDQMISQPVPDTHDQKGWQPLKKQTSEKENLPLKKLKGRMRAKVIKERQLEND
ncbi:MAG: radical SAM protein [Bdellovibrionales bacterium]